MDNPNTATNNDTIEQLSSMSTPTVSTLTTATPITSEIVSDFEPDSKFEITTLEMASYDCQDLYSAANLLEPQDVEPHTSAHATGSEVDSAAHQQTNNSLHSDQVTLIEPQEPQEIDKSKGSTDQLTSARENHRDLESITLVEQPQQTQELHASTKLDVKPDQQNDCKPDNAEKNIENQDTPSSSIPQAQANQIVTDSNTVMQPAKVDSSSGNKSVSETETDLFSADQTSKTTDLNVHLLSQTSVDAQMEKVIDNIVELGGVHQFPQSLVNPEGKEEFLATIHREITGERGSIDLIADVASRQKSIEIEPVTALNQQPEEERKETATIDVSEKEVSGAEQMDATETATEISELTFPSTDNKPAKSEVDGAKLVNEQINQEDFSGQDVIEELVTDESKTPVRSTRRRGAKAKEKTMDNEGSVHSSAHTEEIVENQDEKASEEKVEDVKMDEDMPEKLSTEIGKVEEEKMEDDQMKTRSLRPRGSLKRTHADDSPVGNPPKAEPPKKQMKKSRGSTSEHAPIIKLPNFRSRTTISSSDPITRLDKKYETKAPSSIVPIETGKKYVCEQCGYATDRLNNLVYHSTKSFCQGKCQIGEVMKADIIRQQQQAKNKRRSMR